MATKEIDICSQAALMIGANTISSFTDGSREGEVFGLIYERCKRSELTSYQWNFNVHTERLAQEVNTPILSTWKYIFIEPTNLLLLLDVTDENGRAIRYEFSGKRIYTNSEPAFAKFHRDISESDFPDYFTDILIAKLAAEASRSLDGDLNVVGSLWREYDRKKKEGRKTDAMQNEIGAFYGNSPWLSARGGPGGWNKILDGTYE